MPSYNEYFQDTMADLATDLQINSYERNSIVPKSLSLLRCLSNMMLQSAQLLNIFNKYTDRSLTDLDVFDINKHFKAVQEFIDNYEETEEYSTALYKRLASLYDLCKWELIKQRNWPLPALVDYPISIKEELTPRNTFETVAVFIKIAKTYSLNEDTISMKNAMQALYMASKYIILGVLQNQKILNATTFDSDGRSALALIEIYKLEEVADNLPYLTSIQAYVQKNTNSCVDFANMLESTEEAYNKFNLHINTISLTNEFGG